jgi:hypothetical protein
MVHLLVYSSTTQNVSKYITASFNFINQVLLTDKTLCCGNTANCMINTKTLGKVLLRSDTGLNLPLCALRNSVRNINCSLAAYNAERQLSLLLYAVKRCFDVYCLVYRTVKVKWPAIQMKSDVCCRWRPWHFTSDTHQNLDRSFSKKKKI